MVFRSGRMKPFGFRSDRSRATIDWKMHQKKAKQLWEAIEDFVHWPISHRECTVSHPDHVRRQFRLHSSHKNVGKLSTVPLSFLSLCKPPSRVNCFSTGTHQGPVSSIFSRIARIKDTKELVGRTSENIAF